MREDWRDLNRPLRWSDVYREAELYKAALRVYTKPLFQWRKALSTSTDEKTLYDLAARGLRGLDAIHQALKRESFECRAAVALDYNFNGRHRTLYVFPWEERIVDLLLYRTLNRKLHRWFSPGSYAYRDRTYGLDRCQARIAQKLRSLAPPVYLVKRDIADYFASVDHGILLDKLATLADPADYLFRLLEQRVRFSYQRSGQPQQARVGIPFGSAVACLFANIYLTELDREIEVIAGLAYFRYADDILVLSGSLEGAAASAQMLDRVLNRLKLATKPSHQANHVLGGRSHAGFTEAAEFRHLGLQFGAEGDVALPRDKCRKVQNLFRYAFRRSRARWNRIGDPLDRAKMLAAVAAEALEKGVRNVAIIDYYLKHLDHEEQLRRLDRWLAEEVLSIVFEGHKKGNFGKISFRQLRALGLPSLVHRRRLILHRRIESPFFIWQRHRFTRARKGTVARLLSVIGAGQPSLQSQKQRPAQSP